MDNVGPPVLLHPTLLLDPAAVFSGASVDARLVPTAAAMTPTHYASQEDPTTGAGDGQRPTRVPLKDEQISSALTEQHATGRARSRNLVGCFCYLTGIHASFEDPGTQHPLSDLVTHQTLAHCAVDDPNGGLLQDRRGTAWKTRRGDVAELITIPLTNTTPLP